MQVQKEFDLVERPWGHFLKFTHNEYSTVKLLHLSKGKAISYQYHNERSEQWYLISGKCWVTKEFQGNRLSHYLFPKELVVIDRKEKHKLEALEDSVILEISFGKFDEKDIVRLD